MDPIAQSASFSASALLMGLFGGLALFLYGLDQLAEALKSVAGAKMKVILARLTKNRFMGVFTGAFVTAVIQSSSVTTVLVVGFITAGLMTMTQSVGVILGANIGTTITAQIIAFKITHYALLLVTLGFGLTFVSRREKAKQWGMVLLGLGLVFYGMGVMGDAMNPLRGYQPFLDMMIQMELPLLGILAGAAFTGLVQSSSATTGIVIVMAGQGFITLPAGIALIFGANIGTCITALLAAIGKPREALRAGMVHVLFNVLGVLIWLAFIDDLAAYVVSISPVAEGLTGLEKLGAETPRQIANAHTIFNIANTVIFIGFAGLLARAVEYLVPERPPDDERAIRVKYLDMELLTNPSLALDRARMEILNMGDQVREMMTETLPAVLTGNKESLAEIAEMDNNVDRLYGHIVTYLGKVSKEGLTESESEEFMELMEAANSLESIGDVIETNLVTLGQLRIEDEVQISQATREVIEDFHAGVLRALDMSLVAVTQRNPSAAMQVIEMKARINELADSAALHEAKRLVAQEPNRLEAYRIEMDILEALKRIYYFCKRMARGVPTESE